MHSNKFWVPINFAKASSMHLLTWQGDCTEYLNGKRPFGPAQREFAAFFAAEDIKGTHFNTTDL